jgi:hypothetical protein
MTICNKEIKIIIFLHLLTVRCLRDLWLIWFKFMFQKLIVALLCLVAFTIVCISFLIVHFLTVDLEELLIRAGYCLCSPSLYIYFKIYRPT